MKSTIQRLKDNSIELTISIPWDQVKTYYDAVVDDLVKTTEIKGFRKGKAPRKIVEKQLDSGKTYEEVIRRMIPNIYDDAVREHKLKPIVVPKIELKEATEGKDWVIRAITCEKPDVKLGEYKKNIQSVNRDKNKKIWVPGQDQKQPKEEEKEQKVPLDKILAALSESVTVTIPDILTEQEVNRLLSDLIDQTKKLGLTVEQYLSATGKTVESVRKEYADQSARTLTLEFALEKIADTEGVLVSDDDIDTVIKTAKTEEEKKSLANQRYYIASVLRRQKTLDFLAAL